MLNVARRVARGFSLIELLITLAIVAIALVLAMPSYSEFITNARVRSHAESVISGIQYARSEAIKRNAVVRFQLVDDLTNTCAPTTSGRAWIVSQFPVAGLCGEEIDLFSSVVDTPGLDTSSNPLILQKSPGLADERVDLLSGGAQLCFNGMGQFATGAGCAAGPLAITLSSPDSGTCADVGGPVRCLRLDISAAGLSRMCDPAVTAVDDPRRC